MNKRVKNSLGLVAAALVLIGAGTYAVLGCPQLWAKDFPIDPKVNAHLAGMTGLSVEDAAFEAFQWDVPDTERVPKGKVSMSVTEMGAASYRVRMIHSALDDSYHDMFDEVTLSGPSPVWSMTRLRRCWTGRDLFGWSTGIPN